MSVEGDDMRRAKEQYFIKKFIRNNEIVYYEV